MVILVPVGHLLPSSKEGETMKTFSKGSDVPDLDTQDWPSLVERARKQVIESMESRLGITGLREKITWEEVNTPITCKFSHKSRSSMFRTPDLDVIREGKVQPHSRKHTRHYARLFQRSRIPSTSETSFGQGGILCRGERASRYWR